MYFSYTNISKGVNTHKLRGKTMTSVTFQQTPFKLELGFVNITMQYISQYMVQKNNSSVVYERTDFSTRQIHSVATVSVCLMIHFSINCDSRCRDFNDTCWVCSNALPTRNIKHIYNSSHAIWPWLSVLQQYMNRVKDQLRLMYSHKKYTNSCNQRMKLVLN